MGGGGWGQEPQQAELDPRADRELERPLRFTLGRVEAAPRFLERASSSNEEPIAGRGERHLPGRAHEEAPADLLLEPSDPFAESGRRKSYRRGGVPKGQRHRRFLEAAERF